MTLKRTSFPRGAPKRKAGIRKSGRIKPKKRSAAEFRRIYHSVERVKFVEAMGCLVCGEAAENHHIINGGTSRKANYDKIVPLCSSHHWQYHDIGRATFERVFDLDLDNDAAETERLWLAHTQRSNDDAA